ncbi:MAG: nucleotidyltransferase family protein [Clostridiales bacterium]|nr:nucleotidyltransferase family protein [Clostridiales bacterium]
MKICAIICEYNPLHYGHLYHIEKARELTGCDAVMCIQAGNFTQRGEPAIANKYVRATMALEGGADIVVQIPTAYCCSSAEIFALAGVKIANSFENVTHLAFGCETDNYELLKEIAKYFANEPKEFKEKLNKFLDEGNSLPVSRQKAIEELIKEDKVEFSEITETLNILTKPNNILAIEYLKALYRTKSKIEPVFTTRSNSDYNSADLNGRDSSATAIRTRLITKEKIKSIKKLVPSFTYDLLKEDMDKYGLPDLDLYNDLCSYVVKTSTVSEMKNIYDVSEGIENRFFESAKKFKDFNELLLDVKTKRYTYTRLKRIVLRLLLKINKDIVGQIYKMDKLPFIKVLAFNARNKDLLSNVSADTNIIIRNSNVVKNPDTAYKELADIEDRANAVYNMLLRKTKEIPNFAPDLFTQTLKYDKKQK